MFGGGNKVKFDYDPFHTVVSVNGMINEEPVNDIPMVAMDNYESVKAEADRHGVLRRPDKVEDKNNDITFLTPPENKVNIPEKEKFFPCERLLMTIQEERPELIKQVQYKKISTKRMNKLRDIRNKLRQDKELELDD